MSRVLATGCSILDAGCSILDARCSILDARYWILDARCWILDARYWILDSRYWLLASGLLLPATGRHGGRPYLLLVTGLWSLATGPRKKVIGLIPYIHLKPYTFSHWPYALRL